MPTFSLLAKLRDTSSADLLGLVATMQAQTLVDWELVLVVGERHATDLAHAQEQAAVEPRVRVVVRPAAESLAQSATTLLPTLGSWLGLFAAPQDRLAPDTLDVLAAALLSNPSARIAYTDEEAHNRWGHVSRRWDKSVLNPVRLRLQDHLGDLAVVSTSWLSELGGFEPTTALCPAHDLHLRTLDALGPGAFVHVPGRRYLRFRDARRNAPRQARFDPEAIRRSLFRAQLPGQVQLDNDTARVRYQWGSWPAVTVLLVLEDDLEAGQEQLLALGRLPLYQGLNARVLHRGTNLEVRRTYQSLCAGLHFALAPLDPAGNLPNQLNQEVRAVADRYVCLLQGRPCNLDWLRELVAHIRLPGIGAAGARILGPVQLRAPGVLGYRYDGWDWNSRGRADELLVAHQTAALSPYGLLLDVDRFRADGGFDPTLPTLYGMDYTMRLDIAGRGNVWVPGSQVLLAGEPPASSPEELAAFTTRWAGWSDRFGLHQPIG